MKKMRIKIIVGLVLCVPQLINAQATKSTSTDPAAEFQVSGIIFSSRGGVKFPDGSVQTTAYLAPSGNTAETALSAIVIEFDPASLIEGNVESRALGISKGLNILSASNGMGNSATTHMGSAGGSGRAVFQDLSFSRVSDFNSPRIRFYVATGRHIAYVELFFLKMTSEGTYELDHKIRMENCIITLYNYANGGEDIVENIAINYSEVFYCSYGKTGPTNTVVKEVKFGYDIVSAVELPCDCASF